MPPEADTDIRQALRHLYGRDDFCAEQGVVHVVSTTQVADAYHVLRIGPQSPRSATDQFVLGFSRARADVIITTGQILRDEPELRYELPAVDRDAWMHWRRFRHRRCTAPRVLVLTREATLDVLHPTFRSWASALVYTTPDVAEAFRRRGVEAIGDEACSLTHAIDWARRDGARTISIEAGPRTARQLYRERGLVDELLLSVARLSPDPSAIGAPVFDLATLRRFGSCLTSMERDEFSGPWTFERWRFAPRP